MPQALRCVLMRGGTSKGVVLREEDLPGDPAAREQLILRVFGSPDRRQVDGLGGGDPLTSKVAIVGPPPPPAAGAARCHVSYTFGQVELEQAAIDYASPCGNIVSAVGLYAVDEGLVEAVEPVTRVRIHNTNLGRTITVEIPVEEGRPAKRGSYAIAGVPGVGPKILVDLAATAGSVSGRLLPTGQASDWVELDDGARIEVSLLDIGNPHVFVRAGDLGLRGAEAPREIDGDAALMARVEAIRGWAAVRFGLVAEAAQARHQSRATPMVAVVAPPMAYRCEPGPVLIGREDADIMSRLVFLERVHPSYAATSIACIGIAARLPGTVVRACVGNGLDDAGAIRIGHPAGVVDTEAQVMFVDGVPVVTRATFGRTARRILDGVVHVDV